MRPKTACQCASQSQTFPPSLSLFVILPFSSTSRLVLSNNAYQHQLPAYRTAAVCLSSISFRSSLYAHTSTLFNRHRQHSRGRRYYTSIELADKAARMFIRPPSCSSRRVSSECFLCSQRPSAERLSARSRPIPLALVLTHSESTPRHSLSLSITPSFLVPGGRFHLHTI